MLAVVRVGEVPGENSQQGERNELGEPDVPQMQRRIRALVDLEQDGHLLHLPAEYQDGVAVQRREPFRAYESYEQSFQDYVQFLQTNPRYQGALKSAESADDYIQGLQDAGYATDPRYAEKIRAILARDHMADLGVEYDTGALDSSRAG